MSTQLVGRTLARSQALQLLFQAEANGRTVEDVLSGDYALSDGPLDPYAERLALGADAARHDLDLVISSRANAWSLSRMPAVDRNLLRLALYEMLDVEEVAVPVTIDESVELAKIYGTDDSYRFVNGLLGRVSDDIDAGVDIYAKAREATYGHEQEPEQEPEREPEREPEQEPEPASVSEPASAADEDVVGE